MFTYSPWSALRTSFYLADSKYDAVVNRLLKSENGEVYTYHYGTYNRLVEVRQYIAPKTTRFTYDNAGNTVTKNDGTNSWTYTYDKDNRLTTVVKNGQTVSQYSYDADGKRVKKIENSITTVYVYRGLTVLYEKILENNTVTKYVYGAGKIIAKIRDGTTTYFHQDHLGSTRLITDSNGASVFDRNYRPFGTEQPGSGVQDYKYTAKPQDSATGLYYFGARYYDPELGR